MQVRRLMVSLCLAAAALPLSGQQRRRPTIEDYEAAARTDSLVPEAQYRLAMAYGRLKRPDATAAALSRALAIDPRYTPALVALSFQAFRWRPQLFTELPKRSVPPEWRDSLQRARALLRQAFMVDPLAELNPPDLSSSRFFDLYLHSQMASSAAKPRDSLSAWFLLRRGLYDGRAGSYPSAIADYRELLRRAETIENDSLVPFEIQSNDYRYVLAVLHERANQPADAVVWYKDVIAHDLGHYMAYVGLARVLRKNRVWNDAVDAARRAVDTNPEDATAVRELGEILLGAGRLPDAEGALKESLERNPRDVGAWYVLGVVYQQQGSRAAARSALERFVAVAPAALYERQLADARARLETLQPGP